jgi:eukaryotic-like serine/threonine-protein kinase
VVPDESEQGSLTGAHKVGDVGRYRLIAELARGGMGIVYLALVRGPGGFNKLFVVKTLKAHLAEDPKLVSMFLEEARLAARLSHPNVVQTIEVGSDGGTHFIAMEFLDGQSFHRVLARGRRTGANMPLSFHLYAMTHILEGLQYAHGATDYDGTPLNLVHRDVSPHNVFLSYDGQVKILDFGIAKALDSSNDTRTGMLKGKIAYMAPEQASGAQVDRRADVFAAGVMLWESVIGQRMWDRGLNDLQILHALSNGAIPRPRQAAPDLDPVLERVILKATSVAPSDRFASAGEMQVELEAFLKGLDAPAFGPRDVGKFVGDLFLEERGQIKGVIDGQLRVLRGTSSGEYGMVDMPKLSPLTAPSGTPSGVLLARPPHEPAPVDSTRAAAMDATSAFGSARRARLAAETPRRTGMWVAIVVAAVSLMVASVALVLLRGKPAAAPALVAPSAVTSAAATLPVAPPPPADTTSALVAPAAIASGVGSASAAPVTTVSPPSVPRGTWLAPRGPQVAVAPAASAGSSPPAPTAAAPPAVPAATATATAHVRQQIDTSNPYGH